MRSILSVLLATLVLSVCDRDDQADYDGPRCVDAWVAVEDECAQYNLGDPAAMDTCVMATVAQTFGVDCEGDCKEERSLARGNVDACVFDVSGSDACIDQRAACGVE